ncbi:polyketide synthase (plasmid) [Brasilonema octagenarum UFV-E1]|uniref:Phenolphthiocerol/phthiocerol polyketide synthase subunit E n=2 Tax=Brasilonema TaxID=383614 RepID=A0A856MMI6_9CYAN|nr:MULTISPECIES: type I polyketide synthase [Brasilonema]NMF62565.1 polyketide synthase [Brasilonema octagenarum UFV-OR1]QDL12655.1 polyketide synthase [Brasilonema sennae CENA114]QDL19049.1 polyketide synthase [Brasilonema octagenarum UFV-E1]
MNFEQNGLEIAIVGMSGRFPGAKNIDEFWECLKNGKELITVFSDLEQQGILANGSGQNNKIIKVGAILDDVEMFDASFFGFSPKEAETMDPQHRLFLECAWEALENAGYDCQTEEKLVGVYASVSLSTYLLYNIYPNQELMESRGFLQTEIGVDKDYIATRVSYKLNLKGPSVTVQTACSSSLVAVHFACQSLLNGECDMALAAGVSIKVPQNELTLSPDAIVSPDGHCRAFDAKANGTVGGNGVGVVVLKRLKDAIADNDRIYAVIKGSAINNDGSLKIGYTAPSQDGQARVIRTAQAMAEVEPETITYMEAHGTGTPLGDPIEIAAMTQAFRCGTDKNGYCAIGSVKTNVGHLNSAAGIAGLIKTVLALQHKLIPPSLNFEIPNSQIDFENNPFYVNNKLSEWKVNNIPRRAGVSSFGFGGTNAHVILEEAPALETSSNRSRSQQLLVLSAKTPSALETATTNLANYLRQHPDINLPDVAYTLQVGRQAFNHRRMVIAKDIEDAVKALASTTDEAYLQEFQQRVYTQFQESSDRPVVFMFTGQGAQYVNMTREIYQSEPTFRQECDSCCELLKPYLGLDLRSCLYPKEEEVEKAAQQLQQTAITQPTLFVIEYALAKLWMSWGVQPVAMIGHSIGEYVAATLAGVFSLEDALVLVTARGQLMQELPSGSMLAVPMSEEKVQPFLAQTLSLAAINGSSSCVVSGTTDTVEAIQNQLASQGIDSQRLHTSHAFHSHMMEPILKRFTERVTQVSLKPPQIPYISNVTGTWITAEQATDPSYWASHIRQTVRFAQGLQELLQEPSQILLEVGPGRTLSKLAKQHPDKKPEQIVLTSVPHPQERKSDVAFLLQTLGQIWLNGVQVDWSRFYASEQRHRLPLPTYPFERQGYWIEPPQKGQGNHTAQALLGKKPDIGDWFYLPFWKPSVPPSLLQEELAKQKSCILVLSDECGLGSQLEKKLRTQNQDVITVKLGSEFAKLSECLYTLNPQQPDDYEVLLNELQSRENLPTKIVHLWNVTPQCHTASELELLLDQAQDKGFYSLLFLAKVLGKLNLTHEFQITVVSNNLQKINPTEILCPEKATLLGPVKVIPQEYPNITCRSIDVVLPSAGIWQEKLVNYLITELIVPSSERFIAYRGNHRWVQTFEPVYLDKAKEATPRLREGGVYLITGGLGSIGLVLAEYLAKTVRAKLVLTGRLGLPNRDRWCEWLSTHSKTDGTSRKIRKVQELEELGAEVLVASADAVNLEQMREVIAQTLERFGQINGVIHAAGVVTEKTFCDIEQITKTECEQQFQPKIYGLLVLKKVLQDKELDFCLLLSSLSSVLGGLGYVAYSAANLFMDAFVHHYNQTNPVSWLSVNWDGWQLEQDNKQGKFVGDVSTELAIAKEEGVEAFTRILSKDIEPQVVVSTGNLQARIDQWIKLEFLREKPASQKITSFSLHSRPNLPNGYVAPKNETEQKLVNMWQDFLGVELIGIHDNFFELGGHSLMATQIVTKVREVFQIGMSLGRLFEEPTVAGMAQCIETIRTTAQQLQAYTSDNLNDREEIVL